MQFDKILDHRQSNAEPALGKFHRAFRLHEHLENRREHLRCDANSVVLHAHDDFTTLSFNGERDLSTGKRGPQRSQRSGRWRSVDARG